MLEARQGFFAIVFGNKSRNDELVAEDPCGATEQEPRTGIVSTVKDPFCGFEMDPKTSSLSSDYRGKTYYFCSPECKKDFDTAMLDVERAIRANTLGG